MRLVYRVFIAATLIALASSITAVLDYTATLLGPGDISDSLRRVAPYVQLGLFAAAGVWIVSTISEKIREVTQARLGSKSIVIASVFRYTGYVIVALLVLLPIVNSSTVLAGGAFAGLVIGLALQPVLENFFAGLLILLTGYITVGDRVRIVSTEVPYFPAQFPVYKYFSADYVEQGFKGTVVEIELFFSRIMLDSNRELRVPNKVLLNAAVIDYSPKYKEQEIINVRVELPLCSLDLDSIESKVRELLADLNIHEGPYLNEQSDKDHVIVLVRLRVPTEANWRAVKHEALKRLLKFRQELMRAGCPQATKA